MYSLQLRGPYPAGHTETITLSTVYRILQVGVEHAHSTPLARYYLNNDNNIKTHITIDGMKYAIMENDILELDNMYQYKVIFEFPQGIDEYTIIDIAFIDVDD